MRPQIRPTKLDHKKYQFFQGKLFSLANADASNAANAVGNLKDSDLGKFFKKIAFRKGRRAAITATARKLAGILWNMITEK